MQKEYFGFKSINKLKDILKKEDSKEIFLVTGKESFELCGAKRILRDLLKKYKIERFNDFSVNPELKDINRGFNLFKKGNYDIIISVGGGSCIDVAKAIKLSNHREYNRKIPLIAIPTTSGSGSEATHFIVYYTKKEKQSKGKPDITLPNYSICDPQFIINLPKDITASTGLDALSQAVESYWSINSTKQSKKISEESINLSLNHLKKAVNNPTKESKENMMKAANLAGKAINISKTTACHSISYPITSYFNIPHGHAASLTLGEMLVYNSKVTENDCLDKRGAKYVQKTIHELTTLLRAENPLDARDKIEELIKDIGLETKLSKLNISNQDLEIIIEKGFTPERVKNNPRLLTKENLRKILKEIY